MARLPQLSGHFMVKEKNKRRSMINDKNKKLARKSRRFENCHIWAEHLVFDSDGYNCSLNSSLVAVPEGFTCFAGLSCLLRVWGAEWGRSRRSQLFLAPAANEPWFVHRPHYKMVLCRFLAWWEVGEIPGSVGLGVANLVFYMYKKGGKQFQ